MTLEPKRRAARRDDSVSIFIDGRHLDPEGAAVVKAIRSFAHDNGFTLHSVVLAACDEYLERHAKSLKVVRA